jgi:2',3'-cyclic-nucleotide 2'-phosphodiesterase (5'-nucleotidase family)
MRFQSLKIIVFLVAGVAAPGCQRHWQPKPDLQPSLLAVSDKIAADPSAENAIAPYREQVSNKMAEVLGFAPVPLEELAVESMVGNFVADLQRTQAEKFLGKPIDIGLMTSGGIRTPLKQGNLTLGDIFELMPFENELQVITVNGQVVQQLLIYASQAHIYKYSNKVISTSNITYTIKNNQPQDVFIGGQPLDINKNYTVALSDYLAKGGDNLGFLKEQVAVEKTGLMLREVIAKEIRELTAQGKPVEAKIEGRVKVIELPVPAPVPVKP